MKERQNLPAPCRVNSFCITIPFSFTFLPLQYEKDVQLIKRKNEESEGRAAAGRDVLEPLAFEFAITNDPRHSRHRVASTAMLATPSPRSPIAYVPHCAFPTAGSGTSPPPARRRSFLGLCFIPIRIPSTFKIFQSTRFVQILPNYISEITHFSYTSWNILDQFLQLKLIGKGKSIKHVVQAGE